MRRRAFVIRVHQDETGRLWGHIAEPVANWRLPFGSASDLWAVLAGCLGLAGAGASLPPRPAASDTGEVEEGPGRSPDWSGQD